jgi:hypothetical protein
MACRDRLQPLADAFARFCEGNPKKSSFSLCVVLNVIAMKKLVDASVFNVGRGQVRHGSTNSGEWGNGLYALVDITLCSIIFLNAKK